MIADTSATPIDGEPTKAAGTVIDATGVGTVAWTEPGNARAADGSYATATHAESETKETHYLKATNFGFGIPATATVRGILVGVSRKSGSSFPQIPAAHDARARIVQGGVIKEAQDKALETPWDRNLQTQYYGGASDLWGQTWTPAQINSSEFGFALAVALPFMEVPFIGPKTRAIAEVDSIIITVAYAESSNENRVCFASRSVEFTDSGVRRQHVTDEVWGDAPAPIGMHLKAPAPGQAGRDARLLVVPSVGDFAARADAANVKLAAKVSYRPGYLHAREAAEG